ncbi:chromatin-remodeling ATPase INO80-like isoform X3 [Vicia villosa]|uniref:chromatin-remodeling ATPase INO80-like isoform X3 n=1 Tax=Vicia villosa TaxID=3911 RepID=UPI00273B8BE8|nr:chromatin-remodeling ATPase INO80-like isoform X3 [Vicia villosa]
MYEPSILEIGDGVTYKIPPVYDKLATSLNLLSFSDIHVDEFYLKGTWDLGLLAAMMASDKRLGNLNRAGMGEHLSQYESLQARIKAMSASNLPQKFSLNVSDIGLNSSIPEGAAGSIKRSILSEGGVLQVYYVKVLEKVTLTRSLSKAYPRSKRPK